MLDQLTETPVNEAAKLEEAIAQLIAKERDRIACQIEELARQPETPTEFKLRLPAIARQIRAGVAIGFVSR